MVGWKCKNCISYCYFVDIKSHMFPKFFQQRKQTLSISCKISWNKFAVCSINDFYNLLVENMAVWQQKIVFIFLKKEYF